jgi:pre-mRNA-processing factor 39
MEEVIQEPVVEVFEREIDKHWKIMETAEGYSDFSNWTKLLQMADKLAKIEEIRVAYDKFLTEFPLCYVYWKKYADHEEKKGTNESVIAVYERGLTQGIPHSIDLWTYYCTYVAEKSEDLDEIRALFERGLSIGALDFASHPLWDKYIEFENSQEEFKKVADIYERILRVPLEQINSYWERYKLFVSEKPLHVSATGEELKIISSLGLNNDEKRKNWVITQREKNYTQASQEANLRRQFEKEVLKISYFHVRPLEHGQLEYWEKYLKFEIEKGNKERIVKLYERCIIPCSNYPKFWFQYINYIESTNSLDGKNVSDARAIFQRATQIFLKKRPDVHFAHAIFEECYGEIDKTRDVFERMKVVLPGHVEGILRYICFEKRQGNKEKCNQLYMEVIESPATEDYQKVFLYIHYAKLALDLNCGDSTDSRNLFSSAVLKFPHFKDLWIAYILFEKSIPGSDLEERVVSIYNSALASPGVMETDKQILYSELIQFLSESGTNVQTLRKVMNEYREKSEHNNQYVFSSQYHVMDASQSHKRPHDTAFGHDNSDSHQQAKFVKTGEFPQQQHQQYSADPQANDYSYYQTYYDSYAYAAAYGQMIAQGLFPTNNNGYEGEIANNY